MYLVVELQTNDQGVTAFLTDTKASRSAADQKYHTILAAAAVSGLPIHSACIIDPYGNVVINESYVSGTRREEIVE